MITVFRVIKVFKESTAFKWITFFKRDEVLKYTQCSEGGGVQEKEVKGMACLRGCRV